MKLRIHGNALRLRLTQNEVSEFGRTGRVESSIIFGAGDAQHLTYALVAWDSAGSVSARISDGIITIIVPRAIADEWTRTDQVGFEAEQRVDAAHTLSILVEKDFKCLHVRPGEDEADTYPNPALEATD